MPRDTRGALSETASRCQSRSLLLDRLVFFDKALDGSERIALDLVVDGGAEDLKTQCSRLESELERHPDRRPQLDAIRRVAANRESPHKSNAPTAWVRQLPETSLRSFKAKTAGRLALGLANGVLENCGIYIHRFYNIPFIPGSTLKGIALDAARALGIPEAIRTLLFGNPFGNENARQGLLRFLPAYPTSKDAAKIVLDIATPHYMIYYGRSGNPGALENEGPNPRVFPVVEKGSEFEFHILIDEFRARASGAEPAAFLDQGVKSLRHALAEMGVGAKTAAGYGRFSISDAGFEAPEDKTEAMFPSMFGLSKESAADPLQPLLNAFKGKPLNSFSVKAYIEALLSLDDDEQFKKAFELLIPETERSPMKKSSPVWAAALRHTKARQFFQRLGQSPQ